MQYRNVVLTVAVGSLFATMVARLAISPVVPDVIAAFGVSEGAIGLALTGMWAAYAAAQYPGGVFGERYGERRVILVALGATGVGSALLALAPGYASFAVFAVLLGGGAGLYFAAATNLLIRLHANTGQALGFHETGASLGGLVAPVAAVAVAVRYGWRAAPLLGVVAAASTFLLAALVVRPAQPTRPGLDFRERFDPRRVMAVLSRGDVAFTVALAVLGSFVWQSFAAFFPTFLVTFRGMAPDLAGLFFGGIFAVSVVALPTLGRLSDVLGRDAVIALSFGMVGAGFLCFAFVDGLPAAVTGAALLGLGFGWPGVVQSKIVAQFDAADRSAGFGLVRSVYLLLGSTGSAATGVAVDLFGWQTAYGLLVAVLGAAVLSLVGHRVLRTAG